MEEFGRHDTPTMDFWRNAYNEASKAYKDYRNKMKFPNGQWGRDDESDDDNEAENTMEDEPIDPNDLIPVQRAQNRASRGRSARASSSRNTRNLSFHIDLTVDDIRPRSPPSPSTAPIHDPPYYGEVPPPFSANPFSVSSNPFEHPYLSHFRSQMEFNEAVERGSSNGKEPKRNAFTEQGGASSSKRAKSSKVGESSSSGMPNIMTDAMEAYNEMLDENASLIDQAKDMRNTIDRLQARIMELERPDRLVIAGDANAWGSEKNVKCILDVIGGINEQLAKHMECPISSSIIKDPVYMKGHFYEKDVLNQLFNSSTYGRTSDPFSREKVFRSDVVEGTWLSSLKKNIKYLFEKPSNGDLSPIDTILHNYVESAPNETEKNARKAYVARIRYDWNS